MTTHDATVAYFVYGVVVDVAGLIISKSAAMRAAYGFGTAVCLLLLLANLGVHA